MLFVTLKFRLRLLLVVPVLFHLYSEWPVPATNYEPRLRVLLKVWLPVLLHAVVTRPLLVWVAPRLFRVAHRREQEYLWTVLLPGLDYVGVAAPVMPRSVPRMKVRVILVKFARPPVISRERQP